MGISFALVSGLKLDKLSTLECSKFWMWIYFRDILLIRISRGTNNCVQHVFEKKYVLHNEIFPHFKFLLPNERLDLCFFFFFIKDQRD